MAEHGSVELDDGAAGVGKLCSLAAGWGDEEVGDRHVEEHRQQVQLVGVEAAPAFAVEAVAPWPRSTLGGGCGR